MPGHVRLDSASSGSANSAEISPELVPLVTLLSAQNHRRYMENNFMLLHDLNNEGAPGERKWTEVYGVLSGTQLAIWNAEQLLASRHNKDKFSKSTSKPEYLNLADSNYKASLTLPSLGKALSNVILLLTTLKNRYILQFSSKELLLKWHAAFRLLTFEYSLLQEAYTGALLSARGAKLSDIKVILSESKYNHEHWVSVRFGAGRPWKRVFAVVDPNPKGGKKHPERLGKVMLYAHDKIKKAPLIATIVSASSIYAVYPSNPAVIDASTMIKMDGAKVAFNDKLQNSEGESAVFIMPEAHMSVPGYDTLIRFLIPTLDAFKLYGRPKKLNADKKDPASLLFGLPVLPHVHYLQVEDVIKLSQVSSSILWPVDEWSNHLKDVLKNKMLAGYSGCGSAHGLSGALNSPALDISSPSSRTGSPTNPNFTPTPKKENIGYSRLSTGGSDSLVSLNDRSGGQNLSNSNLNDYKSRNAPPMNGYVNSNNNNSNPYINGSPSNPYQTAPIKQNMKTPILAPPPGTVRSHKLPLPSDANGTNEYYGNGHSKPTTPVNPTPPRSYNSSKELPLPSDRSPYQALNLLLPSDDSKRMSEITQIYNEYGKLPSPSEPTPGQQFGMQNLRIADRKVVDDSDFDLDTMLSNTKREEKRNSKLDIDIFDPSYSEALMSPASDALNPFRSLNSSPHIQSPTVFNGDQKSSYKSSPSKAKAHEQPKLPQISIDDDLEPTKPSYGGTPHTPVSQYSGTRIGSPFQQQQQQQHNGSSLLPRGNYQDKNSYQPQNYSPQRQYNAPGPRTNQSPNYHGLEGKKTNPPRGYPAGNPMRQMSPY